MPDPDGVKAKQTRRAKFLGAVYDSEAEAAKFGGMMQVTNILEKIGETDMDQDELIVLVNSLVDAGFIESMGQTLDESYPNNFKFTPYGRSSVEQWVTAETKTTDDLPVSYRDVYYTTIHQTGVGSFNVVQSTETNININNQWGQQLKDVVTAGQALLTQHQNELSADERDEYADDLAAIQEQGGAA